MRILINKEVRRLLITVIAVILFFIVSGQVAAGLASHDYKQSMILHDYEVAGYLVRSGLDESHIVRSFTAVKTVDDGEVGRELLQAAGYDVSVQDSLVPAVKDFHRKYAVILLALSIAFSVTMCAVFLLFILRQYTRIEKADSDIRDFMAGKIGIRLDDREEGSLSKLFASVNALATSQVALVGKETKRREFLKDTISDISHQLKTPLAALRMYTEIIQNEETRNPVVNDFTSKIEREIARMESLVQDLLKLAKLDAGAIDLEKSTHSLRDFLEEVIERFRTRCELENKRITLDCDERIAMDFDGKWLLEAISNIIKNALDHTEAHDLIQIRCSETPLLVQISIEDSGTGIHPEDIHHIFKRFYRSRFSKDKQGVGIGLTLAKTIIEKHGGTVTVESELGKGTAFHLAFPKIADL